MTTDTGGPAFPRNILDHGHGVTTVHESGMTLRDFFAAKAMQGLIQHFDFGTFRDDPDRLAMWSYDAARAMLRARDAA